MTMWKADVANRNAQYGSSILAKRRPIFALLQDNITVTSAWFEPRDTQVDSIKAGRIGAQTPTKVTYALLILVCSQQRIDSCPAQGRTSGSPEST
jgi:hypothetical protein